MFSFSTEHEPAFEYYNQTCRHSAGGNIRPEAVEAQQAA